MSAWRYRKIESGLVRINVNGVECDAAEGEPLAAALVALGRWPMRSTQSREPRGPFCLIGQCHDCVAEVDGQPGVRTCMTIVKAGMRVRIDA